MSLKKKRIFILGLDGMSYSLIKKLSSSGIMQKTEKILQQGNLFQTDAAIPDVSSVSWSSFFTGKSPAEHGILGFVDFDPESYKIIFPNFFNNSCKAFWEKESLKDKKCIVVNVPGTYPARPFDGILISGFPAVDFERAVHPSSLLKSLKKNNYAIDIDPPQKKEQLDLYYKNLIDLMNIRINTFRELNKNKFDIFFMCFTEIDRFHHFFYDRIEDQKNEGNKFFLNFYKILDENINEIYSWRSDDDVFIMVSDHGFTKIKKEFYINYWLKENNYQDNIYFEDGKLNGITSQTIAFALDPCRIFLHKKNKYPLGIITDSEYEEVRTNLIERLLAVEYENKKIIKHVFRKEEIYPKGNYFAAAADIICLPEDGIDIKAGFSKHNIFGNSTFTGMHTQHDALFFINNPQFKTDHKLNIGDLHSIIFQ